MKFLGMFLLLFAFNIGASSQEACIKNSEGIIAKLRCVDKITIKEISKYTKGILKIEMLFKQPASHADVNGQSFEQRIVLLHRSLDEPMLLQTSGYAIFGVYLSNIAKYFKTNQLQVEHRYFEKSIPEMVDWSLLNIKESADDFHQITLSLKQIYKKSWVNTGASKGGMTSLYHRYFYPDDVVGTVADVAPLSFSTEDKRYIDFVENVGGDRYKDCREKLKKMQRLLLENREMFLPQMKGNFEQLGGVEIAFEHSVLETPFAFWQYGHPRECLLLPNLDDIESVYAFFKAKASISSYSDESILKFQPYYFQAAVELGSPATEMNYLKDLIKYDFNINQYIPKEVKATYTDQAMLNIKDWALNKADEIIYIYGEFDPWTAAEFPVSQTNKRTYKFYVRKGNHGANFTKLRPEEYKKSLRIMSEWLGKEPVIKSQKAKAQAKSLESFEFIQRSKLRL